MSGMNKSICTLCGEPMPEGEQMFKFHGYSGPCPKVAATPAATPPASAGAGMVLVPVEPTKAMIAAGRWSEYGEETSRLHEVDDDDVEAVWHRMMTAAPSPAPGADGGLGGELTYEQAEALADKYAGMSQENHGYLDQRLCDKRWKPHKWVVEAVMAASRQTKVKQTTRLAEQPGSPDFDGAEALEIHNAATDEPMVRFCPGCGSVGDVDYSKHRDCCPDGTAARVIPASLADRCRDLFQLVVQSPAVAQPPAPSQAPAVLSEAEIDAHLDAILRASGSALKNYTMPKSLADMRAAVRAAMQGSK